MDPHGHEGAGSTTLLSVQLCTFCRRCSPLEHVHAAAPIASLSPQSSLEPSLGSHFSILIPTRGHLCTRQSSKERCRDAHTCGRISKFSPDTPVQGLHVVPRSLSLTLSFLDGQGDTVRGDSVWLGPCYSCSSPATLDISPESQAAGTQALVMTFVCSMCQCMFFSWWFLLHQLWSS